MNELEKYCEQQITDLDQLLLESQQFLKHAPKGNLRISHQKDIPRYYWKHKGTTAQGLYIRRNNLDLVQQLAQKDYVEKYYQYVLKQRSIIVKFLAQYNWDDITKFHETLSPTRQALVTPLISSDAEYALQWEQLAINQKHQIITLPYYQHYPLSDDTCLLTERGELVRSKSEKIIADKLHMLKIPYIYEMPLQLKGNIMMHPDFTVLNTRTRKEYHWEHFGLMEKETYSENAVKKLNTYALNNIYQGKKLLVTYETTAQPLNTKRLEGLIQEFLL